MTDEKTDLREIVERKRYGERYSELIGDLEELEAELRNAAQGAGSSGQAECANVLESFAEELEELIEES